MGIPLNAVRYSQCLWKHKNYTSHIALLVIAMLHKLVPGFIEDGRLYWLKAPLYKVAKGKKISYYYSEEEFSAKTETGDIVFYKG